MAADKPKKFEEAEKELEQYGSWVKGSSEDFEFEDIDEINSDYSSGDPNNALMTEEEEMLLGELESNEPESESSFADISFDDFDDLSDEMDDTFGMEPPDVDLNDQGSRTSDLSVKILQSIESELVGLRNEVKDLKTELSQLHQNAPYTAERPPTERIEDDQPASGFFEEEDDDETIALTGDELDNILGSAEVEEESISEADVDELMISEEFDDFPEEFEDTGFLDEDELQDTEDLIKDTELDSTLMDGLTLGGEDPALAELTEPDNEIGEDFIISEDGLEDFDLDSIPDFSDDTSKSFDLDGESFEVEEFDGLDGETFTVEEYTIEDIDLSAEEVPPPIPASNNEKNVSIDDDSGFDEGEEIDITIDEDIIDSTAETTPASVPFEGLEEIDLSSFDENLIDETSDFEQVDLETFTSDDEEITIDIEPEVSQMPDLDESIEEDFEIEELSLDEELELPELNDRTPDEDATLDEFSIDELLAENDDDFNSEDLILDEIELPDLDDFSITDDEITIDDTNDEISLDEMTLDDTNDEISLDEITLDDIDDENSLDEISLDDITIDDIDDEISLDEITLDDTDDEISLDEITLDDTDDEISLDEITLDDTDDEISFDEITLNDTDDEISLDEISLNDTDDEISLDEITLDDTDDEISLDEFIIDDTEDEISLDEFIIDDTEDEISLDEFASDDLEDEISLDEMELPDLDEIIAEEEDLIDLPDVDEIVIEEPEIEDSLEDIELPDLDDMIMEEEINSSDIHDDIELPDLDEIIIEDDEPESLPDLDEILAESSIEEELSSIELPDMDDFTLDDEIELPQLDDPAEDNLFGDDSESVDLDSLEQLAVEEPEISDENFASEFNDRVEEIRDAAKNGNVPEELKDEIKDILLYMDQLLESLPDEKIQEFARSEHFEVYKKIFEELGIKK